MTRGRHEIPQVYMGEKSPSWFLHVKSESNHWVKYMVDHDDPWPQCLGFHPCVFGYRRKAVAGNEPAGKQGGHHMFLPPYKLWRDSLSMRIWMGNYFFEGVSLWLSFSPRMTRVVWMCGIWGPRGDTESRGWIEQKKKDRKRLTWFKGDKSKKRRNGWE